VVQFGKYCQIGDTFSSEHVDVELSHNFLMPFKQQQRRYAEWPTVIVID